MFNHKLKEQSNYSEFIVQKTRLFHSKIVYRLRGECEHLYSKKEVLNRDIDPRCKVCGMLLSEYRTTIKFERWNSPMGFNGE